MRWVRTNLRFGSWCAVLAMAVQLMVAFGHVHRTDAFRQVGFQVGFQAAFLPPATAATHGQSTTDDQAPPSKPIGSALDFCAICVVAKMGATMLLAQAPAAFPPAIVSQIHFAPRAQAALGKSPHRPFEARGPPFA
jgi:hypothetical protein